MFEEKKKSCLTLDLGNKSRRYIVWAYFLLKTARLNLLTCIPYTLNPFIASRAALAIPIELVKQRKLTGQSQLIILVHCIINNKFSISKNFIVTY